MMLIYAIGGFSLVRFQPWQLVNMRRLFMLFLQLFHLPYRDFGINLMFFFH